MGHYSKPSLKNVLMYSWLKLFILKYYLAFFTLTCFRLSHAFLYQTNMTWVYVFFFLQFLTRWLIKQYFHIAKTGGPLNSCLYWYIVYHLREQIWLNINWDRLIPWNNAYNENWEWLIAVYLLDDSTFPFQDASECVSGCMCPSGHFDDGQGSCVKKTEDCSCKHNGQFYKPGVAVYQDCNRW